MRAERLESREQEIMAQLRARPRLEGQHITETIYCLPGDQKVTARGVTAATMRDYEGDIVIIEMATGDRLTVTPNHPILTRCGLVPAGLLYEGAEIIKSDISDTAQQANDVDVPTEIAEVFHSLSECPGAVTTHSRDRRHNFHGDGANGVVDVVLTSSLLRGASVKHGAALHRADDRSLARRDHRLVALPRFRRFQQDGFTMRPARIRRAAGSSRDVATLTQGELSVVVPRGVAGRAHRKMSATEVVGEMRTSEPDTLGKFRRRLPGQISLVKIAKISRAPFSGHVYNLTTKSGFFLANSIAVGNCGVKAWGLARLAATGDIPPTPFDDSALLRMLMGTALGGVLEEGRVSQIQTVSPDTQDVGTIDVWLRDHPVEIKVTYLSMAKDIMRQEHWLEQLSEYVYRSTDPRRTTPYGELWAVHLLGDHGRKRCAEHGVPVYLDGEKPLKEKHPDTGAARMICPECRDFLEDGDRNTSLRCHRIDWTWAELQTLHAKHAWRQEQLQADILNLDYQPGNPPPVRWGFAFECGGCPVKERIGCAGMDGTDLEAQLEGSILEPQEAKA